jgi:hypothetical protein
MSSRLRRIAPPVVVAPPTGTRVRTRLHLSPEDAAVLQEIGEHLSRLAGRDLAARCALGLAPKHEGRTARKKRLTPEASSRWAGSITRTSADQWERGNKNLLARRRDLRAAVRTLKGRIAAPVAGRNGRVKGYSSQAERWQKQRRLQILQSQLSAVEARLAEGRVSIARGGKALMRARHNLRAAGMTATEWGAAWSAARLFLTADGEASKLWGNETIRVCPDDGGVEIRLPTPLASLSNTPGHALTYRLACAVRFNYLADEWAAQVATGAVRYDISFDPRRGRWYIDASWTRATRPRPELREVQARPTLAVDVNADHLAAWVVGADGNPLGPPITIPQSGRGSSSLSTTLENCAVSTLENCAV